MISTRIFGYGDICSITVRLRARRGASRGSKNTSFVTIDLAVHASIMCCQLTRGTLN